MAKSPLSASKATKPRTLDEIIADGYVLETGDKPITRLALESLRISLESWFTTIEALGPSVFSSATGPVPLEAYAHGWDYSAMQAEAIVHFQHFAELVCKDLLRSEHELLATVASSDPLVMYRLLKGKPVSDAELSKQYSVEFSEALTTIVKLIKEGLFKPELSFVVEHEPALRRVNALRNRLWHRGTFALRVNALDELFGRFLLPFAMSVVTLPGYKAAEKLWRGTKIACGVDVLLELQRELTSARINTGKVVYLKELGRASYRNPLHGFYQDQATARWAQDSARRRPDMADVSRCPCCGLDSLVKVDEEIDNGEGDVAAHFWFVRCECCTFHIESSLGNASEYSLPMADFFLPVERPCPPKRRRRAPFPKRQSRAPRSA